MAPVSKAPQLKWSQEEVDVLVEMTNDQLELEAQDRSRVVSWTVHWKRVSSRLKQLSYNRTPTACRGIWRRGVQEQEANRVAAGSDWDESEHEILLHMTKKQLDLEKIDQSNLIPWAKHWKKVSLQLDESGYARTPENCAAYWTLVESDVIEDPSGLVGEEDADDEDHSMRDTESAEANGPVNRQEDVENLPSSLAVTSSQISSKTPSQWSLDEYENLARLLKERRQFEADQGLEILTGSKLWIEIAQFHKANGFDRSFEGCKTFWSKQGRERSGFDERVNLSQSISKSSILSATQPMTKSTIQPIAESSKSNSSANSNANSNADQSNISNLSLWSPVNEAEAQESLLVSRNPAIDVLKKFQKDHSSNASSDLTSTIPQSTDSVTSDIEHDQEYGHAHRNRRPSLNSSTPTQSAVEKNLSTAKQGLTSFRFTPEQRVVLEAEALRTGGTLSSTRRAEIARDLDVEEKTIRNWFNNYNVKARRSQGSTPVAAVPTFTHRGFDDVFKSEPTSTTAPVASTATPLYQGFVVGTNFSEIIPKRPFLDDGTTDLPRPAKNPRLEAEVEKFEAKQGFNPINGHSNQLASQGSSIAHPPSRNVSGGSVIPAEEKVSSVDYPLQSSNSGSTAPRVVQISGFTAISMHSTLNQPQIPSSGLQLKSTPVEPIPHPETQRAAPKVSEPHPSVSHPTVTGYPNILWGNDKSNSYKSSMSTLNDAALTQKAFEPYVWSKEPKASDSVIEPRREARGLEHVASVPVSKGIFPTVTAWPQSPPNRDASREWPRQPSPKNQQQKYNSVDTDRPISTPVTTRHEPTTRHPPSTQQQYIHEEPRPFATPATSKNLSSTPQSTSTPSDEDLKLSAQRHVESFRSDIQNLTHASAARTARITSLGQEISSYASKHNNLIAAKDAEIAQILKEVKIRYEGLHAGLQEHEQWLEKEKQIEVEGLKSEMLDLTKKKKGLERWQGIVEYYDNEGEEEL